MFGKQITVPVPNTNNTAFAKLLVSPVCVITAYSHATAFTLRE